MGGEVEGKLVGSMEMDLGWRKDFLLLLDLGLVWLLEWFLLEDP